MQVIRVRNVHKALPEGLRLVQTSGMRRDSRNGSVLVVPTPVTTWYAKPRERVLFWAERDANPFFHFFECLWMLAGRRDVQFLDRFVKRMKTFSDDGETFHGAYGHRWRQHFDVEGGGNPNLPDQLPTIISRLIRFPDDRRCVLTMWDPCADLNADSKDLPCNTHVYFSRDQGGFLDMTVSCRSNDMILGAYGANAVHFSFLQEYVAGAVGCGVGGYWQMSNNYHAYVNNDYDKIAHLADQVDDGMTARPCPYELGAVSAYPIKVYSTKIWDEDLGVFFENGTVVGFRDPFFRQVVTPMWHAHQAYGSRDFDQARDILAQCAATDWRLAATQWITRRQQRLEGAKADGT